MRLTVELKRPTRDLPWLPQNRCKSRRRLSTHAAPGGRPSNRSNNGDAKRRTLNSRSTGCSSASCVRGSTRSAFARHFVRSLVHPSPDVARRRIARVGALASVARAKQLPSSGAWANTHARLRLAAKRRHRSAIAAS